jgi:alpha-N-arabinofuranosidase
VRLLPYHRLYDLLLTNSTVLGVWAGLALNGDITPQNELQFYIDDALNQIEFIRGTARSAWGSRRAALGHPEPFILQFVEIGNEDWLAGFPSGWESYRNYRFPMFYEAISAAYPDIQIIASSATSDPPEEGEPLDYPPDVIGDYHPYREPDDLVEEFNRFDNDIGHIIGEVAATHPNGGTSWEGGLRPLPWWQGAVGEAVSMIGYERNADRIPGTFYAPVIRNTNRWQWAVTLLQNDAGTTTRSVSWYVWSLFGHHPISETLAVEGEFGPVYFGAGKDENRDEARVWKGAVYNTTGGADMEIRVRFDGILEGEKAALTILTNLGEDGYAENDPATGVNVVGVNTNILTADTEGRFVFFLPELSVAVLDTDVEGEAIGRFPGDGKE